MNNYRLWPWMMVVIFLGYGCNTTPSPQNSRIAELRTEFELLPSIVKAEVSKGGIAQGYTLEMVYMALGRPDDIETMADGVRLEWTYRNFYPSAKIFGASLYGTRRINPLEKASQRWMNSNRREIQDEVNNGVEIKSVQNASMDLPDMDSAVPGVTLSVIFIEQQVSEYRINGQKS